ncbi:MAG: class I SAM-dependent methyltransferase [Alphaproteobacteria bacterium]|jgi:SAM-dependent methyltransferase|nr:class I SAM-dependent methyltransferase [Alphaproteobacteria bacterium]MBT7941904.1 class I SAM-dependent methyltransferase [Alphaproteobacteria bacterium]
MDYDTPEDFYNVYATFKRYQTPVVKAKHVRWYDREFWSPARCTTGSAVLELGSGPGEFLSYLKQKGVTRFQGVEQDTQAVAVMEAGLGEHVFVGDIWDFLDTPSSDGPFDCVVMLDVLEHFSAGDGVRLLQKIKSVMAADGRVVIRVPNMGSPWGGIHQFADLTHKTAFTPNSLEQLGQAAGFKATAFVDQRRGSPFRRLTESILHGILSRVLAVTPIVWSPNMIAVLEIDAPPEG